MKVKIPTSQLSIPVVIWILTSLILVAFPLRIISYGFLPPDDALRHAAKAVSGKSWSEILVMRPDITIDHNPGWHWFLGCLHRFADWDVKALVRFSVMAMFLIFAVSPLPWLRRPEAWLASLAVVMLVFPYFAERAFTGRPLFLTMASSLTLLCMWTRPAERGVSRVKILLSVVLIAVSAWVHGSWYMMVLLPLVFFLARAWRKGLVLIFCWAAGSILGALFTGEPWTFLRQSVLIPFQALGRNAPVLSLVGELQPFTGGYPALIVVAFVLIWRKLAGRPLSGLSRDPVFWLAMMGWLLGFRVFRFWLDWGIPALALWLARQLEELLVTQKPGHSWLRVAMSCGAALVLYFGVANDRDRRWSQYGKFECLEASRPEHAGWLPDPGGVLYCVNLSVFYQTFFQNPHGDWRYVLGFEPTFMRPQDLAVYQELWRSLNAIRACAPWVKQMTPADRLVLLGGPRPPPAIYELQWYYAANNTWVGRLPRPSGTP